MREGLAVKRQFEIECKSYSCKFSLFFYSVVVKSRKKALFLYFDYYIQTYKQEIWQTRI